MNDVLAAGGLTGLGKEVKRAPLKGVRLARPAALLKLRKSVTSDSSLAYTLPATPRKHKYNPASGEVKVILVTYSIRIAYRNEKSETKGSCK